MLKQDDSRLGRSGRFDIRRRLGEGAVGVVYEAYDREHGATVALKTLRLTSPESLLSLKTEFRTAQGLRHRNLVSLGELLEEDGTWFFTMELLDGRPFTEALRDGRGLRDALGQLVEGLRVLHTAGFVHRDVKPSNVLVTNEGRVVLLDFGIAKHVLGARGPDEVVGTSTYMAPEQALGDNVGEAADWYAVGVVLYQVLTGRAPYAGTFQSIVEQKLAGPPRAPRELAPDVPPDLDALCMALLSSDPAARPSGEQLALQLGLEVQAASHRTALVGRDAELRSLHEAYGELAQRGITVLVHGESGVGKSFLVDEFVRGLRAAHPGLLVLSGRCYERESVPYKAFDGVVDQLSQELAGLPDEELAPLLPPALPLLMRAFPVLQVLSSRVKQPSIGLEVQNPQEQRARIFAGMRELFARLSRTGPLALVVDDLQWADADSFQLLHEVMRPPNEPRLMFVATVRTGTETRRMGQASALEVPGEVRHVTLEELSPADATELARKLLSLDDTVASEAQVRTIVEDAKGHPLFIDELVRQRKSGHGGSMVRLDDALWERARRLEAAERRALELVAVAGTPITLEAAARTAGVDFAELFQVATKLRAEALLRMSGARRDSQLETYHDRVRESVLGNLTPEVSRHWHLRLASVLEDEPDSDAESIAGHWHAAGNVERAASYYVAAAEQAKRALAFDRAARLFRLALAEGTFGAARIRELKEELAQALVNASRLAEGADVLLELAPDAAPAEKLSLERRAAQHLMCSGHFERGLALMNGTLRALGAYNPGSRLTLILSLLFWRLYLTVRGLTMRSGPRVRTSERDLMFADAAWSAGQAFGMNDNIRAVYFHTRCLIASLDSGEAPRVVRALGMAVAGGSGAGLPVRPQMEKMLARTRELADGLGTPEALAFAEAPQGLALTNFGCWRESKPYLDHAEALLRDHCPGMAYELSSVRCFLFRVLFCLGELEELERRGELILRSATQQNDLYQMLVCESMAMSVVHTCGGRPAEAARSLAWCKSQLAEDVVRLSHYWTYTSECHAILHEDGDLAAAHRRIDWLYGGLKAALLTKVASVRMFVLALRGRLAVAVASRDPAQAGLLEAALRDARVLAAEPIAWGKPSARSIEGAVALARGELERAVPCFAEAAAGYDALSMPLYAAAARRREGELRGGDEGRALIARADDELTSRGVAHPERLAVMLAGVGPRR